MAPKDTEIPQLAHPLEIPRLKCGAMADSMPYPASPEHQASVGFPGELLPDWKERALAKMKDLAEKNRAFQVYLDACVKCGACTDKCHYFIGTGDPKNMPVARQDLLRSVYRRYFTFAGKHFPWLVGARDLTEDARDGKLDPVIG
ncbi:MAG: hypothetical protein P1U53_18395, partial [Sulfitobacter sp.]|nr:hypothetical protein [Sulfitobacter sp.]